MPSRDWISRECAAVCAPASNRFWGREWETANERSRLRAPSSAQPLPSWRWCNVMNIETGCLGGAPVSIPICFPISTTLPDRTKKKNPPWKVGKSSIFVFLMTWTKDKYVGMNHVCQAFELGFIFRCCFHFFFMERQLGCAFFGPNFPCGGGFEGVTTDSLTYHVWCK